MERKMMDCGSWFLWILGLGIILAMVGSRRVHAAISCSDALNTLTICEPFLKGVSPSPGAPCCESVSKLYNEASTTQERWDICQCLNEAAHSFGVDPKIAKDLSPKCGFETLMPIDPDIDCNT
ncbi:hypothetical protein SLE2022_321040 [Rubroshorea leprosula]